MTEPIEPSHAALLVMDYQNGIVERLDDHDALLSRAADAIATARRAGIAIGYVRVAFTDEDLAAFPPTSRMGQRVSAAGGALHDDSRAAAASTR